MGTNIIKKTREKKGVSQQDLADQLGMSRNIIVALENGKRELKTSETKKLSGYLGVSVQSLMDDQFPDFDKYKEMILKVLACLKNNDGRIPKTKLAKMLYLADFTWFYHHMESMSGMSYRRIQYGPVPDEYFRALEDLEWENLIDTETEKTNQGHKTHLVSLAEGGKQKDLEILGEGEKELISKIVAKWEPKSTKDIVGFTHQQLPYKLAEDGEIISYALIGQLEEAELY